MTSLSVAISLVLAVPLLKSAKHDMGLCVYDTLFNEVVRLDRASDAAWVNCASVEELERRQASVRAKVLEAIGGLPERTPLNAQVTGRVEKDGCRIEKVLFESRPRHFVTAHLFLPDETEFKPPWPGVVVPCGHSPAGKNAPVYQRGGLIGAKTGLATLVFDPVEQGERRQRLDPGWRGSVHGHNHIGHRAHLLGWNTAQFRIWDGIRACDYLASRPDIDKGKLGVTGMSGGGTLSAYLNALDSRYAVAAPSGFISTISDVYDNLGPQDAEQVLFGQVAFGFNHTGVLALRAPSPVMIVATHGDYFPFMGSTRTFDHACQIYSRLGKRGNVALMEAAGPHGWFESTRHAVMSWIRRWTTSDACAWSVDFKTLRRADLGFTYTRENSALALEPHAVKNVTKTGRVIDIPGSRSVFDIMRDELARLDAQRYPPSRDAIRTLSGIREHSRLAAKRVAERVEIVDGGKTVSCILSRDDDLVPIPLRVFIPSAATNKTPVLVVCDKNASSVSKDVQNLCAAGRIVAVADLRGFGETAKARHSFYGAKRPDEELAVLSMTIGENLVARRAEDAVIAASHLAELASSSKVELKAYGRAAIPAAHAYALHGKLFSSFGMIKPPPSWRQVIEDPKIRFSFADSVYGALTVYDWTDLADNRLGRR